MTKSNLYKWVGKELLSATDTKQDCADLGCRSLSKRTVVDKWCQDHLEKSTESDSNDSYKKILREARLQTAVAA